MNFNVLSPTAAALLVNVSYFMTAFLFIMGLKRMSSPVTARSGMKIDWTDEVFAQSCLTHAGEIKHEPTRKLIG